MIKRISAAVSALALSAAVSGCSTSNRSMVREDLMLGGPATTQTVAPKLGVQLVRVEQDGTAVLHFERSGRTVSGKAGETVTLEEKAESCERVTFISVDPAAQQARFASRSKERRA